MSGKTFFDTGATGRVGCAITARLEELGATVLPVILHGYPARPKSVPWTAASEPIEIKNDNDLLDLPRPDYAIHLHWKVDRTRSFTDQIVNELDWNVHRPAFVWKWLKEQSVARFINCSSIRVFSRLNENPVSSQTEPQPLSPYGIAKLAGEKYFASFFGDTHTRVTQLRLCSVYSIGEHPTHLLSQLASSAFHGERITLNSGHSANLIHIDEATDLIISSALKAGEERHDRCLVVAEGVRIDDIAAAFERICKRKLNAEYVDLSPGVADLEFVSDIDGLRMDWVRTVTLEDGIKRIVAAQNAADSS